MLRADGSRIDGVAEADEEPESDDLAFASPPGTNGEGGAAHAKLSDPLWRATARADASLSDLSVRNWLKSIYPTLSERKTP